MDGHGWSWLVMFWGLGKEKEISRNWRRRNYFWLSTSEHGTVWVGWCTFQCAGGIFCIFLRFLAELEHLVRLGLCIPIEGLLVGQGHQDV